MFLSNASRYAVCWSSWPLPPRQGHRIHFWGGSNHAAYSATLNDRVIMKRWSAEGTYGLAHTLNYDGLGVHVWLGSVIRTIPKVFIFWQKWRHHSVSRKICTQTWPGIKLRNLWKWESYPQTTKSPWVINAVYETNVHNKSDDKVYLIAK
jgi:hypothetical protein